MTAKRELIEECHFKISGEFITDQFRDFVLEERWQYALKEFVLCMHGMDHAIAIDILSGKKKLVGWDSEITLEDDNDSEKYIKDMSYMYRGLYEHRDGHCYRPAYEITSFGKEDYPQDENGRFEHPDQFTKEQMMYTRSMFYRHNDTDQLFIVDGKPVFFSRRDHPPIWMSAHKTPEEALANHKENSSHLDEDGWVDRYSYRNADLSSEELKEAEVCVCQKESNYLGVDQDPRDLELVVQEQKEILAEEKYQKKLKGYRERIIKEAEDGDGFIELVVGTGKYMKEGEKDTLTTLRIPKAPFFLWGKSFAYSYRIIPDLEWSNICPSGMKMGGDNPNHTDWMVGAGLDLEHAYTQFVCLEMMAMKAAHKYFHDLDDNGVDEHVSVLVKNALGVISGTVVKPKANEYDVPEGCIMVIPFAGPAYQIAAGIACKNRGAVVTEVGGKLCHLAKVGREEKLNLVSHPDAMTLMNEGDHVTINMNDGVMKIIPNKFI